MKFGVGWITRSDLARCKPEGARVDARKQQFQTILKDDVMTRLNGGYAGYRSSCSGLDNDYAIASIKGLPTFANVRTLGAWTPDRMQAPHDSASPIANSVRPTPVLPMVSHGAAIVPSAHPGSRESHR